MSEQELEAKMKQILDDYAPILNVTPEKPLLDQKQRKTKSKKKRKAPENIVASPPSTEESDSKGQDKIVKI